MQRQPSVASGQGKEKEESHDYDQDYKQKLRERCAERYKRSKAKDFTASDLSPRNSHDPEFPLLVGLNELTHMGTQNLVNKKSSDEFLARLQVVYALGLDEDMLEEDYEDHGRWVARICQLIPQRSLKLLLTRNQCNETGEHDNAMKPTMVEVIYQKAKWAIHHHRRLEAEKQLTLSEEEDVRRFLSTAWSSDEDEVSSKPVKKAKTTHAAKKQSK